MDTAKYARSIATRHATPRAPRALAALAALLRQRLQVAPSALSVRLSACLPLTPCLPAALHCDVIWGDQTSVVISGGYVVARRGRMPKGCPDRRVPMPDNRKTKTQWRVVALAGGETGHGGFQPLPLFATPITLPD